MLNLSKIKKGSKVKVISFDNKLQAKPLMVGLGILQGDIIDLVSESFLGSPITVRLVDGETVALRVGEASLINVEKVN